MFTVTDGHKRSIQSLRQNLFAFSTQDNTWHTVMVTGNEELLKRSCFSSVFDKLNRRIILCGGNVYTNQNIVKKLSVFSLCMVNVANDDVAQATVTTFEVCSTLPTIDQNLSSATMAMNGSELYVFGGNKAVDCDEMPDPNSKIHILDVIKGTSRFLDPPEYIAEKVKVSGGSSFWIGDHTWIIIGGTTPPLGFGGRSIFTYSCLTVKIENCDAETCKIDPNFQGDTCLVLCDFCEKEIHKHCDSLISRRKKLPDKYKCPVCRGDAGKQRRRVGHKS